MTNSGEVPNEEKAVKELTVELRDTRRRLLESEREKAECRQAAEALRESERRYRALVEVTSDLLWEVDQNAIYTYVSPRVRDLLGYEPREVLGRSPFDLMPPDEARRVAEILAPIAEHHKPFSELENVIRHKDGHLVVLETNGVPVFDDNGRFRGYRGIDRDITARKKAEQEREQLLRQLRAVNEQLALTSIRVKEEAEVAGRRAAELQAVLDNMVDGVFVCDVQARITLANDAGVRLLGLSNVEEINRALVELPKLLRVRHPDGRPVTPDELPLVRALAGEIVELEDEVVRNRRTKRDMYLRTNAVPIRDRNGNIVGAVEVVRDVTELIELDRLKDEFILVAAHELKTPVAIMKGYAQALLRAADQVPAPLRKMLDAINRGSDRIDRIVKDLLDISQLHLGHLEMTVERIDLPEMVQEVVDRMALASTKHQVRVVRAEPVVVRGDRVRLEQVVVQLIDNAIKYSPAGGDVDVVVDVRDREVVVSVRDYGVGIPEDRQARISERFYRAHTGTPYDYGGMGVGLYISREILSRHRGRVWFQSKEGKGSTFYFSLPLTRENSDSPL